MRFSRLIIDLAVVLVAMAAAIAAAADVERVAPDRVARLIADLGSDEYMVRETASDELARIGPAAFSALEAAANHPDREVRYRSQRVLGLLRQQDLHRRLETFLSGKETPDDQPLPAWSRFRERYGDDAESRALFVDIQRADPELMKALEDGPRFAADTLTQRASQTPQIVPLSAPHYSLGQIVAALFVVAEEDVRLPAPVLGTLFSQCRQRAFREAVVAGQRRDIPRKMLGTVVSKADDLAASQAMSVAIDFNLPEGIVPAERILKSPAIRRVGNLAPFALMTVARLGDASHLPLVENLMNDATLVTRMQDNNTVYEVQLRDEALAAAVLLTKQEIKDYFNVPAGQNLAEPLNIFFNARVLGFSSDAQRAVVFKKWDEYKAKPGKADE